MTSKTDICNMALLEIGQPPITDITDGSADAVTCSLVFDNVVDSVVASKYWSKVRQRAELAPLVDPPEYEFTTQFQLPADFLQELSINDRDIGDIEYAIEKDKLLISTSSVFIKYIQRQPNPELWGIQLQTAIIYLLSARIAYKITGDAKLQEMKYGLYQAWTRAAASTDNKQGSRRQARATQLKRVR